MEILKNGRRIYTIKSAKSGSGVRYGICCFPKKLIGMKFKIVKVKNDEEIIYIHKKYERGLDTIKEDNEKIEEAILENKKIEKVILENETLKAEKFKKLNNHLKELREIREKRWNKEV